MNSLFKTKGRETTPFSDFVRNASSGEKKKVYARVLKTASESQKETIEKACSISTSKDPCFY